MEGRLCKEKEADSHPDLLFNFGILAVLKYSGFVTENLNLLFAKIGIGTELPVFRFLLPWAFPSIPSNPWDI